MEEENNNNNNDVNQVIKDGTNNKNSKTTYILVALMLIFLVCFIVTLVLLIYEHSEYVALEEKYDSEIGQTEDDSYNEELYSGEDDLLGEELTSNQTEDELKENIEIEALGITKSGDFAIKVTNNNDVPVNIDTVSTIFKDENGTFMEKVETYDSYICIDANSETIVYDWGFDEDFSQYQNYEFSFDLSNIAEDFLYSNFEVSSTDTGDQISVQIKNNNSESVESIDVNVVYYENGSIVGIQSGYSYDSTIAEGESAYINVYYPEDADYNEVSFDEYEIYITQADKSY